MRVFRYGREEQSSATEIVSKAITEKQRGFRAPSDWHASFDVVDISGFDLGSTPDWPFILDEAIRLLKLTQTRLIFSFSESRFLTIFHAANFLELLWKRNYKLIRQDNESGQRYVIEVEISSRKVQANPKGWSFGIITNGQRLENVRRFQESVEVALAESGVEYEIIISGVEAFDSPISSKIRCIPEPEQFAGKAWITKKKNLIVSAARYENALIVHDRFEIAPSFLSDMHNFGDDFSVIAPSLVNPGGTRHPDWVTTNSSWGWSQQSILSKNSFHPNLYVNGGAIIAKTAILREIPWSEALFWNQAEDVELSRRLISNGVYPRFAQSVVLNVIGDRASYQASFRFMPDAHDEYPLVQSADPMFREAQGTQTLGNLLVLKNFKPEDSMHNGLVAYEDDWLFGRSGLLMRDSIAALELQVAADVNKVEFQIRSVTSECELRVSEQTRSVSENFILEEAGELSRVAVDFETEQHPKRLTFIFESEHHASIESISLS